MPTYEYACPKCGSRFEQFQSMRDEPLKKCIKCGKTGVKRLIGGGAGLIFKGTGFYITDYKKKRGAPDSPGGSSSSGSASPSGGSGGGSAGGKGGSSSSSSGSGSSSSSSSSPSPSSSSSASAASKGSAPAAPAAK